VSDFGTMRDRIDDELQRSDAINTQISTAIQSAISFYKYSRFWFNEGRTTGATVDGTEYYSLPSTQLSVDSIRVLRSASAGYFQLQPESFDTLEHWTQGANSESFPTHFAPFKDKFRFFPIPDAAYTTEWNGIISLGALSATTDTNAWMVEAEELIRQRAKAIVNIDLLEHAPALAQAAALRARGSDCLSLLEDAALRSLRAQNARRLTNGKTRPML
jgi:hypothetical protein